MSDALRDRNALVLTEVEGQGDQCQRRSTHRDEGLHRGLGTSRQSTGAERLCRAALSPDMEAD